MELGTSPLAGRRESTFVLDSAAVSESPAIPVGHEVRFEHSWSEADIQTFARLSGDDNPLHMESDAARRMGMEERVVHGMLVASLFSRLVGTCLPTKEIMYVSQDVRFHRPVYCGQKLVVHGRVEDYSPASRIATLSTRVVDASGHLMVSGRAQISVIIRSMNVSSNRLPDTATKTLNGKTAVVTGASRGIGAATALALARAGARVVVNFRANAAAAERIVRSIREGEGEAEMVAADVSSQSGVEQLAKEARERFGPIDLLVNNAGKGQRPKALVELDWSEFEDQIQLGAAAGFRLMRAFLPDLTERRGCVVNVLSTFAYGSPPPKQAAYVVGKAAFAGLTRAMALELGPLGIRVNGVAPGLTETEMSAHIPPRMHDVWASQTPLRRNADPDDVARVVAFLCSDEARFLAGAVIPVCGGAAML